MNYLYEIRVENEIDIKSIATELKLSEDEIRRLETNLEIKNKYDIKKFSKILNYIILKKLNNDKKIEADIEIDLKKNIEKKRKYYRIIHLIILIPLMYFGYYIKTDSEKLKSHYYNQEKTIQNLQDVEKILKMIPDGEKKEELILETKTIKDKLNIIKLENKNLDKLSKELKKMFFILLVLSLILSMLFEVILSTFLEKDFQKKFLKTLEIKKLKENLKIDFVTNMIRINMEQIEEYYKETHRQANRSFFIAIASAVLGIIVIIIGIFMFSLKKGEVASLTTIAGILSEFISGINFSIYNKTIDKMSEYHKKLVFTQNISLALKSIEGTDNNSYNEVRMEIVKELIKDINKYLSEK